MKNTWFAQQLVPPVLWHIYGYIRSLFIYSKNRKLMNKNDSVRQSKNDGVVYVLGNGPSLNNFNLESIYGKDVITMNFFYLHPKLNEFNIIAHCIGEPFDCPTWVDPGNMVDKTPAASYWFNISAHNFCDKEYKDKRLFYYLPGVDANFDILHDVDLSRPALQYQSTSQMAIMVAMHLGYKQIYLLGFDHDWLVTRGHSPHFYNEDKDDKNVPKADFSGISYLKMINLTKNLFEVYVAIKRVALRRNVSIVNLSKPTYLDIFPDRD